MFTLNGDFQFEQLTLPGTTPAQKIIKVAASDVTATILSAEFIDAGASGLA